MQIAGQYIEIAEQLMFYIAVDSGVINRFEVMKYPKKWVDSIAEKAALFFETNPHVFTDEIIEEIACGDQAVMDELYGNYTGYRELTDILTKYFLTL